MAQTLTNLNINDNNAVISALREGDEEVFDHIYRYYFRGLCAFCSQYVTLSESEEIVQDTMMWLWENRKTLIPELTLKTLLFTIVKNKALNKISYFCKGINEIACPPPAAIRIFNVSSAVTSCSVI